MLRRVTTQDISWFLDLHIQTQLDLEPTYQRRSVWSPKDRRFFLDTIFRGYPSPSIFLNKVTDDSGRAVYAVVDGKQRLETIFNFVNNKIYIDKEFGDTRLNGKRWRDIQGDNELKRMFWDYVLPVEFINVSEDPTLLVKEVFDRLNRSSNKLTEQELRHAKYDGWFITFVESEIEDEKWSTLKVYTRARSKRMKDVQFLSELFLVTIKNSVQGFDQDGLNAVYANFDNLEEPDAEIDGEQLIHQFKFVRDYLFEMEEYNNSISTLAKDFKDFYSLWSFIAINREKKMDVQDTANRYLDFMEEVKNVKANEALDPSLKQTSASFSSEAIKYYQNSIGANTEFPQRQARYEALLAVISP